MDIRGEDVKTADPEQLIEAYSGFIGKIAAQYEPMTRNNGMIDIEDLKQEGRLGLLTARDSFMPAEDGIAFATWASWYIKNRIRRALGYRSDGTLKEQPALILDAPLPDSEGSEGFSLIDTIPSDDEPPEGVVLLSETQEEVRKAVDRIPNKGQRDVIKSIFLDGKGYKETAEEMNLPVSSVRGRKENGLIALRQDNKLKVFLRLPNLRYASYGYFKDTGTTIQELAILREERRYDARFGDGAFVKEKILKNDNHSAEDND